MSIALCSHSPPAESTWFSPSAPSCREHRSPDADASDAHLAGYSVQDAGFIQSVSAALMQSCILHRWNLREDPNVTDALPPAIVGVLHLPVQDRHAIGMADALLQISDLRERRRVLVQMILAHRDLRSPPSSLPSLSFL